VGRNNSGKSFVPDAIALVVLVLNDFKDVLGKSVVSDIILKEKVIEPKYFN